MTRFGDRSPSGIIVPVQLFRYYGNPLSLWLYCRFYDRQGSGKAVIDLAECAGELQISISTLRKWLCWEPDLWRSWKTRNGIATIYYRSVHNLAAKRGLERFSGGVVEVENISEIANHRLTILATEAELQNIQKQSRYAAHEKAIEKAAIKYHLNTEKSQHRKRLNRLVPKTFHPNDLVFLPVKNMARVLWKTGFILGVSEGFLAYGASQEKVAICRGLSPRQIQRHLSNEYRCSESPTRHFRATYPIFGVQINQRISRDQSIKFDRALTTIPELDSDLACGKVWRNREGRWFERKCKIYEQTLHLRKARFRRTRVLINK
ncbi:MAG: hypothetical protein AAGJ08_25155 [Cyanobacteria bacterium P01_H01_bin.35]